MEQEAGCLKLQSNQILSRFNMPLGIEKIEKEHSDLYGSQGLTLLQDL